MTPNQPVNSDAWTTVFRLLSGLRSLPTGKGAFWPAKGRGKRGGARVVYFHHDAGMPLFARALTAYAKNERADLSQQDRNDFRQLTALLVEGFKRRKR